MITETLSTHTRTATESPRRRAASGWISTGFLATRAEPAPRRWPAAIGVDDGRSSPHHTRWELIALSIHGSLDASISSFFWVEGQEWFRGFTGSLGCVAALRRCLCLLFILHSLSYLAPLGIHSSIHAHGRSRICSFPRLHVKASQRSIDRASLSYHRRLIRLAFATA